MDPKYAEAKNRLLVELERWMKEQGDEGAAVDRQEELPEKRRKR